MVFGLEFIPLHQSQFDSFSKNTWNKLQYSSGSVLGDIGWLCLQLEVLSDNDTSKIEEVVATI
ncbi:hypothetical protein [aff. Roholtiella sp. LEGE 12411]|uniref:hypothetical protein n=1 Tax=aff. Roholtiella sp. LEGE 12411 TaxID=1828822 RepID=UPI00188121C0|nr:hypothetical protein [aff. Roholtiella sp. LEGE 12411]MBE9038310.1 hypothetical protein [aff. Roholtiella sp. LEGE 12411]